MPKKLNSMSFKKNPVIRSTSWTSEETDVFYCMFFMFVSSNLFILVVLNATGPDFGLMHDFIPTRSRAELKKKFKKEERVNADRVNEV
jgi:hypothetical protein